MTIHKIIVKSAERFSDSLLSKEKHARKDLVKRATMPRKAFKSKCLVQNASEYIKPSEKPYKSVVACFDSLPDSNTLVYMPL